MKKLDENPVVLAASPASFLDLQPAHRLIVLLPPSEVDTTQVARKIRELANAFQCHVQFLGLTNDPASEPALRRQIVTLSAMVEDAHIFVDSKIELGSNWLDAVRFECHEGDVIVCFAEQSFGTSREPLHKSLEASLGATIYVLKGFLPQKEKRSSLWSSNALAWIGSILLILGFLWLQMQIVQPPSWSHEILFYLSIIVETGLIWLWNSLIDQRTEK